MTTKICNKCGGIERYKNGKCKVCTRFNMSVFRIRHPNKAKEYMEKNKERIKQYNVNRDKRNDNYLSSLRYAKKKENPEFLLKRRERSKKWREENPEKQKQIHKRHHIKNPSKRHIDNNLRRARINSKNGTLSVGLFDRLFKLQNGKCAYCNIDLRKVIPHLDHIYPISKDGDNVDSNMQILCKKCNLSKNAKDPIDFMQSKGFLL